MPKKLRKKNIVPLYSLYMRKKMALKPTVTLKRSHRMTFLIRRQKASLEEVQKFFPYIAIC